ncbi:hypothetical protein COU75_04655 [Candidatus Peregrinibacteria bacterium CG10_big_fil_rev_8_21_14_0_10_42_8]|nr:MAG: hypothetical protein COU75_04655 [Candidatus Peregrinibacteria bacterium CG10_big_fil_rev_8_21_14_0_10_42_8]
MAYYRTTRRNNSTPRPFVAFLLVASFGILFAGCGGKEPVDIPQADEFTFTAEDLSRMKDLARNGTGAFIPRLELEAEPLDPTDTPPVLDIGTVRKFNAIRTSTSDAKNTFRVTNAFLNVRSAPQVTANQIERLDQGDSVEVVEFVNAGWAKVLVSDKEGYVASRYISKIVSEDQLQSEKKKYEGMYFVDFAFLNVRKEPDSGSEQIGELQSQTFVRPLSIDDVWARIPFGESDGYVARQYLSPFLPNFLVRQNSYSLPIVHYRLANEGVLDAMPGHIDALKKDGYTLWTMKDLYELLEKQEERDVRLNPKTVVIAVSDITKDNVREISDVLRASGVSATLFLQTSTLGSDSIDQKQVLTLLANGHDIQSNGHTGDDLRSLTNSQIELELGQSKKILEEMINRDVFAIAYPLGGVNDRIAKTAEEMGYLLGLSASQDRSFERTQFLRMPSLIVKSTTTNDDLLSMIKE